MEWLNEENRRRLTQLGSAVVRGFQAYNESQQNVNRQTQPSQNELTFVQPNTSVNEDSKSLYVEFSREFLKHILVKTPLAIDKPRPSDGYTPLICAVNRNSLNSTVLLLSNGASVNATDLKGNTAIHHAINKKNVLIVKILLIFRADFTIKNKIGKAAICLETSPEITKILLKCKFWKEQKLIENSTIINSIQTKMEIHKQQIALQYQLNKSLEDKKRSLRLLSLDGGGIRGLVLIQILMELEELSEAFNENFVLKNFDWIAGTSTGAILALALASGFSPIKCLRLYLRLKDDIFSRWPYSDEKFEAFLKANLGENRKMANINKKLKVFVTATKADQIPIKLILFRSYDSPFKESAEFLPQNANIWKAARCSSAAPTYFKSVNGIMDGGLMANNPGVTLLLEVFKHIDIQALSGGNDKIELPELAFMLSLGTGKCPEVPISITDVSLQSGVQGLIQTVTALTNLKSILVEQLSTSDGQVVELARYMSHTRRAPYFRFTPELNNDVQLDTVDNTLLVEMLWTTKEYIREKCSIDVVSLLELFSEFNKARE